MKLIESEQWRVWCDPEKGASFRAVQIKHGNQWVDVMPDCRETSPGQPAAGQDMSAPLSAASFHMIPYSNRIRDGKFSFAGQQIQLDNASGHAMHGALRKLPWQTVAAEQNRLLCRFDSRAAAPVNWPWPIEAGISTSVKGSILSSQITITNHGSTPMPVGTGWHPYFVREINQSMPTLTLPVTRVYPDAAGDCLPDGAAIDLPAELDFREARRLDPAQRIDCCLAGLAGECSIHWETAGIEILMQSSDNCRYLVLL